MLWGVVSDTGTLARGSHVTATSRLGVGFYAVQFDTVVTNCSFLAVMGDTGTTAVTPGLIRTRRSSTNTSTVLVDTFRISSNGTPQQDDYSFHLGVFC
jgi:hypothetical protein